MRYRHLIRRFPLRKLLMLLGALFIAWSWSVQKPAPAPEIDEPRIEYLWAQSRVTPPASMALPTQLRLFRIESVSLKGHRTRAPKLVEQPRTYVTVAGNDHLTANFSANNVGGRIEGGYRFAIPGIYGWPGFGVTPYAALQVQAFSTPSYSEIAASGSSAFALAYDARTTTTTRSELGSRVDKTYVLNRDNLLSLFGRVAWAHDWYSDPSVTARFLALPGSSFTEFGARPVKDSLLLSAGSELSMRNGWSVMAKLDTESAHSQTYIGTAKLRYTW